MALSRSAADYGALLLALLPPGAAWPREPGTVLAGLAEGIGGELARVEARAGDLREEADPRATRELLAEWERVAGLPDPCTPAGATLEERRLALVQRLTSRGGQSRGYVEGIIALLGYVAEIDEFRPFVAGVSRCGARLMGGHEVRLVWRVRVTGPRVLRLRAGTGQAGDRLLALRRAEDLECLLRRLMPAHTELVFAYQGA